MIGVLGVKRVVVLGVLLALNVLLGAAVYAYMIPEQEKQERTLRQVRSKANAIQTDISKMQVEFEQFESQKERFEAYKKDGFFVQQNRREIEDLLKLIQEKSGVVTARVAVNPANIEENKEAEKAEHKVLRSTIQVSLDAFNDRDIFHYLHLIETAFPGHITLEDIKYERQSEVNGTILRAIASGKRFPLVDATMNFTWRTMVPQQQLIAEGGR